jgi:RNA polymerase sigma factor (sigma-70 family)
MNPFAGNEGSADEMRLVREAQGGDEKALEALIKMHQAWIFNITVRMVGDYHLAEDLAQEIIVKAVTKLSTFRGKSRFRTWLYRIAVNHVLDMKKTGLELYYEGEGPREWEDDDRTREYLGGGGGNEGISAADLALIAGEFRIKCMLGMLLCLRRVFNQSEAPRIREIVAAASARLVSFADAKCRELYMDHPFLEPEDFSRRMAQIVGSEEFLRIVGGSGPRN